MRKVTKLSMLLYYGLLHTLKQSYIQNQAKYFTNGRHKLPCSEYIKHSLIQNFIYLRLILNVQVDSRYCGGQYIRTIIGAKSS